MKILSKKFAAKGIRRHSGELAALPSKQRQTSKST
jgi:hypothetical protein